MPKVWLALAALDAIEEGRDVDQLRARLHEIKVENLLACHAASIRAGFLLHKISGTEPEHHENTRASQWNTCAVPSSHHANALSTPTPDVSNGIPTSNTRMFPNQITTAENK